MSDMSFLTLQARPEVVADRPPGLAALRALLIDELEYGLMVCTADGSVVFTNHAARRELALGQLLAVSVGVLRCIGASSSSWAEALRGAADGRRRQLLVLERDQDRLLASLVPLREGDRNLVLVVLGRRSACSALGVEMLGAAYGLTMAERHVLTGLLGQESPRDIARRKGVAVSTVRTQILSIRAKLGVRTVEAVLLRAAEVPPVAQALRFSGAANGAGMAAQAYA